MRHHQRLAEQGFLLVEATLTAVIIGVGLVVVNRALSGSLRTLARVEEYHRMLGLAETTLRQREGEAQQFGVLSSTGGSYEEPNSAYQWTLSVAPVDVPGEVVPDEDLRSVTVTVSRVDDRPPVVRLTTLWPTSWVTSQ